MGRKDASGTQSMPVDQYRKQIGKQQAKKDRKELKSSKQKSDAQKSAMGVKDVILILVAFFFLIVAIYFFLYMYLTPQSSSAHPKGR